MFRERSCPKQAIFNVTVAHLALQYLAGYVLFSPLIPRMTPATLDQFFLTWVAYFRNKIQTICFTSVRKSSYVHECNFEVPSLLTYLMIIGPRTKAGSVRASNSPTKTLEVPSPYRSWHSLRELKMGSTASVDVPRSTKNKINCKVSLCMKGLRLCWKV